MRILILSQWFDPEPSFKGLNFATDLKARGHHVEVLTGFPNYPGGTLYPGYKVTFYRKEVMEGVEVHRVPLYPNHDKSAKKRILNYISFCISSFFFGLFMPKKFDVIYVYHPPMTVGFSAALISLFRRIPFVYDVQDLWPDTLRATGMLNNERILRLVGIVCDWIYSRATKVVVLSPGFKAKLLERGVPANKVEVIYNWCDEDALSATGKAPLDVNIANKLQNRFNVLFAGTMGNAQALDTVLEAARILHTKEPRVQFVFVGGGIDVPRLKALVAERSIQNVLFVPRLPMSEVGVLLKACDVLLVHLKADALFKITVPSKTQAYMAMGKPILMAVEGDAAELVTRAGCGICVPSQNVNALVDAALALAAKSNAELETMGSAGRDFYRKNLSMETGVQKFLDVFQNILSAKSKDLV